jgi:hypothetical protein
MSQVRAVPPVDSGRGDSSAVRRLGAGDAWDEGSRGSDGAVAFDVGGTELGEELA